MGVLIGRIFGTDIRATGGFFLLMGLYYFFFNRDLAATGTFCLALIVSLLIHEFGHVFAVRWQLGSESSIVLWGLGGVCLHEPTRDPKKRIIISLMGPAFQAVPGIVFAAIFLLAPPAQPHLRLFVVIMALINVVWLLFNLIPILPLDGGHALRAALEMKLGAAKADPLARKVSVVCAAGVVALALFFSQPFIAMMGGLLLFQNLPGRSQSF